MPRGSIYNLNVYTLTKNRLDNIDAADETKSVAYVNERSTPDWPSIGETKNAEQLKSTFSRRSGVQTHRARPRFGPLSVVPSDETTTLQKPKPNTTPFSPQSQQNETKDLQRVEGVSNHRSDSDRQPGSNSRYTASKQGLRITRASYKIKHRSPELEEQIAYPSRSSGSLHEEAEDSKLVQSNAGGKGHPERQQKLTLLQELFPEEAQKAGDLVKRESKPRNRRETLPKEFGWAKEWQTTSNDTNLPAPHTETSRKIDYDHMARGFDPQEMRRRRDASVLILSNASKNLAESDFLRLSPKGEHIEGWTSGIIKVIPGRDPHTLETLGHYFILFSTSAAARAYQDTVVRLHHLARTHAPSPLGSPIPPPPGYIKDGEDIHALTQVFTLVPASHKSVSLRMLHPQHHSPSIQRMITAGGHPALVARQSKCEHLVLFSLSAGHSSLTAYELAQMLGRDGRERNLPWALVGGSDDEIVKLQSKHESRKADEEPDFGDLGPDGGRRRRRRPPPRFILSFKDAPEARRFVRAWHRRPFPVARDRITDGDEAPLVHTELLW
ncbi:MAG: hypothetical protein M1818_007947 [Claussenomyces sp. TS43310]|nr:MAG: hypothetical protein M1818_007947 [Claussenomyces sp. TS43310]